MKVTYRHFRGAWTTWEELFEQAARFASQIGRKRVISVGHSEDKSDGVVTVWYWSDGRDAGSPSGPGLRTQLWRGTWATWVELFDQASAFATKIGSSNVLGISHSEDSNKGVIAVWYWK